MCIKNHPGGLRGQKMKQKVVIHHANQDRPERCFVRLFKCYLALMPANRPADAFYLQPSRHPTSTCWFSATPLGHYSPRRTISWICKEAGIGSYKTNHSLRATAVTRLYIVYTSLEWMSSWSWREPEIVALKVFAVTKTHSAKHFLTSSTALRKHELTLAKRSAVFPLFLPLQAPIQNTIDIGCLSPPCKFIFCVLNFRDWSQPQNYPDLW